jgi:hypothetical protein
MPAQSITIPLTQGKFATVDAADYPLVSDISWCANHRGNAWYAEGGMKGDDGKWHTVKMHRIILNPPPEMDVDHRDGDGLNNRRSNLRICTHRENMGNRRLNANSKSGYKGVMWSAPHGKYLAGIRTDGKFKYLGVFTDPEDAARAFDAAAIEKYGEFAWLNFPNDTQ